MEKPYEIVRTMVNQYGFDISEPVSRIVALLIAAEWEACANVAERIGGEISESEGLSPLDTSMAISAAIRATKNGVLRGSSEPVTVAESDSDSA